MKLITICDTGPLLADLDRNEEYPSWAVALMKQVRPPTLVTEPVLTEVLYSLREDGMPVNPWFELLERGAIQPGFEGS